MTLKTKPIFTKLTATIIFITILFWIISSIIFVNFSISSFRKEFTSSNVKIMSSISRQSINALTYYDFYQLRKILHDFYDGSYMDYFALYTVDKKPFAIYPSSQFSSGDINYIEENLNKELSKEHSYNFFEAFGHRRFHFQQQVKDENGQILGYLFMGGRTTWLDKMVQMQIFYFVLLGFFVLLVEIGALIYFAKKFTRPLTQLTRTLSIAEKRSPEELIPAILAQPALDITCSEVEVFDSVVRKLLGRIQEYQQEEMNLSVQATVGRLASHFAHDIKTPLSSILNYLRSHGPAEGVAPEEIERYKIIQKQVQKIDEMADELKSYTKAREIQASAVDIGSILEEAKKDLTPHAHPKGTVIKISCEPPITATLDGNKLLRVINNMVLNSIQAISHDAGLIEVTAKTNNDDLIITVTDNGSGIVAEHLPRIFDSSFTHGKIKGTGLGLAYCKSVIDAHGGDITVSSETGKGTTFAITLPNVMIKHAIGNETIVTEQGVSHTNNSDQWIVIDDTEEFRIQWREIFKKQGLPPPIEFTLPEQVRSSKINLDKLGGAIVDLNFEGSSGNGFDLIELFKSKGIARLHLCTSSYDEAKVKKEATRLKVTSIIPKPIPENIADPTTGIFRLS